MTPAAAVVSHPTDTLVESALPCAPHSLLSSHPSFATASAASPATASANVLPNPAAIQPAVGDLMLLHRYCVCLLINPGIQEI